MGAPEKLDFDVGDASPRAGRSLGHMVIPIGLAAAVVAQTAYLGVRLGSREEKLDAVALSVVEIKTEMYRHSDAEKDREIVNVKLDGLDRRVSILEAAREHHVSVVTARVEKQEDDLLSRASRWIAGSGHK